jgi:hypothetical protein
MYPAVIPICFICAAVILPASLAIKVQFSVPYNRAGRDGVLQSFVFLFLSSFLWSKLIVNKACYFWIVIQLQ